MLCPLTLWHIDRVLLGAEGAFRRRSALGISEAGEDEALKAVTEFRASLPSPSKALRFGVLAVAVLVVAHVLAILLLHLAQHHVGANVPLSASINQLLDSTLSTLQLTASSLDQVIDALLKVSLSVLAVSAGLVSLSLYVILWPVASGFRLKRMLLNLYPDPAGRLASTPASWSVTRAEGPYALEREALALLGARVTARAATRPAGVSPVAGLLDRVLGLRNYPSQLHQRGVGLRLPTHCRTGPTRVHPAGRH
jgi:hypothetical protein